MKLPLLAIVISWLVLPAAPGDVIDRVEARRYFEQAEALSKADGAHLWGVSIAGPLLFVDRASREVVANRADPEGWLEEDDGVYVGTLPPAQNIANTAVEVAGVHWTMLIWPLPEQRYARGRLLAHEMFHRIQDQLGLPAANAENAHLDGREGRIWMRMEWRALAEALIRRGDRRHRAIGDALVFRAHRRAIFPDQVAEERALELNEGLAEYTGFALGGLPRHVLADRAAVQLDDYDGRSTFVRNFAYASGPAYGILLDEAGAERRDDLSPQTDLGDLLLQAAAIELPPDLEKEANRRARRYEGERVIDEETARDEERRAQQAAFRGRFIDGPTLTVTPAGAFRYSFNPNAIVALDDVGTVYLTLRVTDEWGILEVESGGALMIRDGASVGSFTLPAPVEVGPESISGDGWTLSLAEGWELAPGAREGDVVVMRR